MLVCCAPCCHPVDILLHILGDAADKAQVVDVRVEEVEPPSIRGQEGTGIWRIAEEEVVIAYLENPVEGKSSDDLRYM
jgi:hypothetical protein